MRSWIWMVALGVVVGCGSEEPAELGPECSALVELCHHAEEAGVEGAVDCHDFGHEGDEAACASHRQECEAICAEST